MKRDAIDFHAVRPEHFNIHDRLLNWAVYITPGRGGTATSPMFRQYRSTEVWQQHVASRIVNKLDGAKMETAVWMLPEPERTAIRWSYYYSQHGCPVWKVCKVMGVNQATLEGLVHTGRTMLRNRSER